MRNEAAAAVLFIALVHSVGSCSSRSDTVKYCNSDSDCGSGQVCGSVQCGVGLLSCIPAGCECRQGPGYVINPGSDCLNSHPQEPECSCDKATCKNPLSSCGNFSCGQLCALGEACTEDVVCPIDASCLVSAAGTGACRPDMCKYQQVLLPPLCGSPDAPCGQECCQPECTGRQCGIESKCGQSCGTCPPNFVCTADQQCMLDPEVLLCKGDLRVTGPIIRVEKIGGAIPLAEGGTITDGTYDLVATREYIESAFVETYTRSAMRFSNSGTQIEQIAEGTGITINDAAHRLMNVVVDGTNLHLAITCPDHTYRGTANTDRGFTVHGSEVWFLQRGELEVYAPRP